MGLIHLWGLHTLGFPLEACTQPGFTTQAFLHACSLGLSPLCLLLPGLCHHASSHGLGQTWTIPEDYIFCLLSFCLSLTSYNQCCAVIYLWSYKLRVLPYNNLRRADQIFVKFGMKLMLLQALPNSYLLISCMHNTNIIGAQSHLVGCSSSVKTPLLHLLAIIQTTHAAIYQWSHELFDIAFMGRLMTFSPMLPAVDDHMNYLCCNSSVAQLPYIMY
jgi:hypothetical protein